MGSDKFTVSFIEKFDLAITAKFETNIFLWGIEITFSKEKRKQSIILELKISLHRRNQCMRLRKMEKKKKRKKKTTHLLN